MGILEGFYSLGKKTNKQSEKETPEIKEGVVSEKYPELKLEMKNEDIAKLTRKWQKTWLESEVYAIWLKVSEECENYWLGKHFDRPSGDKSRPQVDNIVFEALETYLPQVTRRNPEAMISLSKKEKETPENLEYTEHVQETLGEIADELKLRLKLKKVARHWAIFLLGASKIGWDLERDIPTMKVIRAKKLILDPNATIDEDGYTGEYIGEHRKLQASILIKLLEGNDSESGAVDVIKKLVKDDLGTNVGFVEWWTNEYMCWTIGDDVLMKKKNFHWNYDQEGEPGVDDYGNPTQPEMIPGVNHFAAPKKPYIFLSIFNLGKQPVDDTSLISQNLSNQDLINKRVKQIDKNADSMNGGMVVSGERSGLKKEQAKDVTDALRKGGTVWIPSGATTDAVTRMSAPGLPVDVYNQLLDTRNRLRDIFGTRGSTPSGIESETTVRGKLITRNLDTDRIGGGVSEYLEQFADEVYNWFVQVLYVNDETFIGIQKPKVNVSVKEGSLLPKDSMTLANQAIELANSGKMSLIDLYKALDRPNPEELAANVWLEANAPEVLFAGDERVQQVMAQRAQAAQQQEKPPSESISFKDLTPDAKAQMLAKVGITADPEAMAAYDENKREAEKPIKINEV